MTRAWSQQDRPTVVTATAADEAEAAVGEVYLANRIEPLDPGPLSMQLTAMRLGTTTVGRLGYGRRLRLVTEEARQIHVNTPVAGAALSHVGLSPPVVTTSTTAAAVFPTGAPADIQWTADAVQLCLMVPTATLESELAQLLGRSLRRPLSLRPQLSLTTPEGRVWRSMVELLSRELAGNDVQPLSPAAGRQLERTLLDVLLLGHPHTESLALEAPLPPATSGVIRRAVDLMHDRPAEPWSSTSLARAVHVSVRSLQSGFHAQVGKPPMTYLRELRLRGMREQLATAAPGTTTVEAVAHAWGMHHLGRCAALYRKTFGELPSETLKRP